MQPLNFNDTISYFDQRFFIIIIIAQNWTINLFQPLVSGSDQSFPPSFRMHRNYSFQVRGSNNHLRKERKRTRLLNQIKKSAGVIKSSLPKIKDVNVIDKYSRVVFPVSFILFNVAYWCFYVMDTDGKN